MTVTNHAARGLLGDISVLLNAAEDETFFRSGYALTTGSYWNTCTTRMCIEKIAIYTRKG